MQCVILRDIPTLEKLSIFLLIKNNSCILSNNFANKKHSVLVHETNGVKPFFLKPSQVEEYQEDAHIAFAILDAVDGKTDDAMQAFEAIRNVVAYWNLALVKFNFPWYFPPPDAGQ